MVHSPTLKIKCF